MIRRRGIATTVLLAGALPTSVALAQPQMPQGSPGSSATADITPPGTITIEVVDDKDQPVADADVILAIRRREDAAARDKLPARTDATGTHVFRDRTTGVGMAYRVNVPYQGATFNSPPFQMPAEHGMRVRVRRSAVTTRTGTLAQEMGIVAIQFRENRAHITVQARLVNVGNQTFVFPGEGWLVALPKDYSGFNSPPSMTDIRVSGSPEGARVFGSIAPGAQQIGFEFDIPVRGATLAFTLPVPWRTFGIRVVSDGSSGMQLHVDKLPAARQVREAGLSYLVAERPPDVNAEPLMAVRVAVHGIPTPGPWRWIASLAAALLVIGAVATHLRSKDNAEAVANGKAFAAQQIEEQLMALEKELADARVGPETYTANRKKLIESLARVLHGTKQRA